MQNVKDWFKSSHNPQEVSNTVRGVVLMCSGIILFFAQYFNIPFTEGDVVEVASQIGMAIGGLWGVYGIVMKAVTAAAKK